MRLLVRVKTARQSAASGRASNACSRGHSASSAPFGSSAALTFIIQLAIRAARRMATVWSDVRRLIRNAGLDAGIRTTQHSHKMHCLTQQLVLANFDLGFPVSIPRSIPWRMQQRDRRPPRTTASQQRSETTRALTQKRSRCAFLKSPCSLFNPFVRTPLRLVWAGSDDWLQRNQPAQGKRSHHECAGQLHRKDQSELIRYAQMRDSARVFRQ